MTTVEYKESIHAPAPRKMSLARREMLIGLAFLSPWFIGLVVFTALPIIASLVLSFTDFNLLHPADFKFIGLDNYTRMWNELLNNGPSGASLGITVRFALMSVPLTICLALGLALLLNQKLLAGKPVFRTLFFMPVLIPLVASTIVWQGFLNGSTGWLAQILHAFGLPAPDWFADPAWALPGLVLLGIWGVGNMMLIFLAGLQGVPTELYEAVKIDGGGAWAQIPPCDAADDLAGPLLQHPDQHHRSVAVLHSGLCPRSGGDWEPWRLDVLLQPEPVQGRLVLQ